MRTAIANKISFEWFSTLHKNVKLNCFDLGFFIPGNVIL